MSDRRETCIGCGVMNAIDDRGRIVGHARVTWIMTSGAVERPQYDPCTGSGKPSREERIRRAAAMSAHLTAEAAAAREDAAIALDAFLEGCDNPERQPLLARLPEFERLALHEYRRRMPYGPDGRIAHRACWYWEARPAARRGERSSRGDVFCTFCDERLSANVRKPIARRSIVVQIGDGPALHAEHLTACMLRFLAGLSNAVAPGTKALPEEFRQEIDS